MKILTYKLFESKDFYYEITFPEYVKLKRISMPIDEIMKLKSLLNNNKWKATYSTDSSEITNGDTYITIYKCYDEWYSIMVREEDSTQDKTMPYNIRSSYTYMKVDQFEGLLKFLTDKEIIT